MIWIAAGALGYLMFATAAAVLIGRMIRNADRREAVEAAVERHPAGKAERHLRCVS